MSKEILEQMASRWSEKIRLAEIHKEDVYGKAAKDALRFYNENHDFMYESGYMGLTTEDTPSAWWKTSANLVANMVRVLLPALLFNIPTRMVSPRKEPVELQELLQLGRMAPEQHQTFAQLATQHDQHQMMMQQYEQAQQMGMMDIPEPPPPPPNPGEIRRLRRIVGAKMQEWWLNLTPEETGLFDASRMGVVTALIKGRGILWPEIITRPNGTKITCSSYVSDDDLLIDPDAKSLLDAKVIYRRRTRPNYELERELGLTEGTIKGESESFTRKSEVNGDMSQAPERQSGKTNDIVTYYEVYSRMGAGARLTGNQSRPEGTEADAANPKTVLKDMDFVGDNVFLIIVPGLEYPGNLPPHLFEAPTEAQDEETQQQHANDVLQEIKERVRWPEEFWRDPKDPWPFVELDFHLNPGFAWPIAHVTPAMAYQKCINWIYTFMMQRIKITSRTFMAVDKSMLEELKEIILHGSDLTLLPMPIKQGIDNAVNFIQQQPVGTDLWTVLAAIKQEFEDATGVTELNLRGDSQQQMRSATEASVRKAALDSRVGALVAAVEAWQSRASRKEAILSQRFIGPKDVAPLLGEDFDEQATQSLQGPMGPMEVPAPVIGPLTAAWMECVMTDDVDAAMQELEYRIESGTTRRMNHEALVQNMMELGNTFLPVASQLYQTTGVADPINWYFQNMSKAFNTDIPPLPDRMMEMMQQMAQQMAQQMVQQATQPQEGQPPQEQGQAA